MNLLRHIWSWSSGLVICAAVVTYLAMLVGENIENLRNEPLDRDFKEHSDNLFSATGTGQNWNMFAPNVGTISYSPVVVLVMKDGSRVTLHSIVEPDTPNWTEPFLLPNDAPEEARVYAWRFHLGDGRMRKYESRAASAEPGWNRIRTIYARWRAQEWIAQNPDRKAAIKRVELWRVRIRHPGYGRPLCCESTEMLAIAPWYERERWPVQPIDPTFPFYRL